MGAMLTGKGVNNLVNRVGGEAAGRHVDGFGADTKGQTAEFRQVYPSLAHPPQAGKIVDLVCPNLDGLQVCESHQRPQKFAQMTDLAGPCHFNNQMPAQTLVIRD